MKTSHVLVLASLVGSSAVAEQKLSVDGRWKVVTGGGSVRAGSYLNLFVSGEKVTGSYVDSSGRTFPIQKAGLEKGELKLELEASYQESRFNVKLGGRFIDERYLEGTAAVRGREWKIRLKRLSDPVGVWDVVMRSEDGESASRSVLRIQLDSGGYRGAFESEGKSVDLAALGWKRERLALRLGPFSVLASFPNVNRLEGRWSLDRGQFSPGSGAWSATRRDPIVTLDGRWLVTPSDPDHVFTATLAIADSDTGLRVSFGTESIESKSARFDGRKLTVELELEEKATEDEKDKDKDKENEKDKDKDKDTENGKDRKTSIRIEATLTDVDTLRGRWWTADADSPAGAWVAKRQHPPRAKASDFAGAWKASTSLNDGSELAFQLVLDAPGNRLGGRFLSPRGDADLYDVGLDDRLHFAVRLKGSEGPLRLDFTASRQGEGLRGEWTTPDGNSRQWFAERAKD